MLTSLAIVVRFSDIHLSAFDQKGAPFHQSGCQLAAGLFIDAGKSGAGNAHALRCFLMGHSFIVHQADGLIFFQGHDDGRAVVCAHPQRPEALYVRQVSQYAFCFWSCHVDLLVVSIVGHRSSEHMFNYYEPPLFVKTILWGGSPIFHNSLIFICHGSILSALYGDLL